MRRPLLPVLALLALAPASIPGAARPALTLEVKPAPISRQRHYTMNARVRPLLFWIRKNNVGEARITWRDDRTGAHGYELLVGSDPAKAPRKINKWGYIAEHVSGSEASIVGVMKQAKENSVEDAQEQLAREGQGGYVFETIRANVSGRQFTVGTVQVRTPTDLTFRDLDALLARATATEAPERSGPVPDAADPGFLCATAELLRATSGPAATRDGERIALPPARAYVYNGRLYELRLRSAKSRTNFEWAGRRYGPAVEGEFEITNRTTREITKFSIVYGRNGDLAGIPIKIVLRPKWWFEAELVLGD